MPFRLLHRSPLALSCAWATFGLACAQTAPPPPFGAISPEASRTYAAEALTSFSLLSLRNVNPVLRSRMEQARLRKALRAASFAQWNAPGAPPLLLAAAGREVVVPTAQDTQASSPWGIFGTLAHDRSEMETRFSAANPPTISQIGFDGLYTTLTTGGDYRLNDDWLLGGALSLGCPDARLSNISNTVISASAGEINGNVGEFSGYATWSKDNWYVDSYLTFSALRFDVKRNVLTGSEVRVAEGTTSGNQLSAGISAGYDWRFGENTLSPYLRVDGLKLRINGYEESGSAGYDAQIGRQTRESLHAVLGLRYTRALSLDFGVIVPQLAFEFVREVRDRPSALTVAPLSSTLAAIPTTTPSLFDKSFGAVTLGATGQFANNWSGFAQVEHYIGFSGVKKTVAKLGVQKEL